jgi:hypothetical protein
MNSAINEQERKELLASTHENIVLRNIAVFVLVTLGTIGALATGAYAILKVAISLALFVVLYNNLGLLFLKKREKNLNIEGLGLFSSSLIFGDILAMTGLVHTTGGILSPFCFMYFFPILLISLTAPEKPRYTRILGLLSILFYESLLLIEFFFFPPLAVIQQGLEVYKDLNLLFYFLFVFPGFLIVATVIATDLAGRLSRGKKDLRARIEELVATRKNLEQALAEVSKKSSELAILYEISSEGVFPLDKFAARLAEVLRANAVKIDLLDENNQATTVAEFGAAASHGAEISVIMRHEENQLGVIQLARLSAELEFTEDERRMLSVIADKVAKTIIQERTQSAKDSLDKELTQKLNELKDFHDLAVGRELRMIELEKENQKLRNKLTG